VSGDQRKYRVQPQVDKEHVPRLVLSYSNL
jgi:hypothetical protein